MADTACNGKAAQPRLRRALAVLTALGTTATAALAAWPAMPAGASAAAAASITSGILRAWGDNGNGELGNGATTGGRVPVKVRLPQGTSVTSVREGSVFSLALTTTGKVLAWGFNGNGELGNGSKHSSDTPVKVRLPKDTRVSAVRAGFETGIALTSAGQVLAWGFGSDGELGDGHMHGREVPVRVRLPHGIAVKAVSAGCDHSLALTTGGRVLAWGDNVFGQLGNGSTRNSDIPVSVKLPSSLKFSQVDAGCDHNLALSTTGKLYAWGFNMQGELGDGSTSFDKTKPVRITFHLTGRPIGHVVSLFAGCEHSLALTSSGAVLAWGLNSNGQLGDGTKTERDTAVRVRLPRGAKVKAISAGCEHSLALTSSGHVLAWGQDGSGQLGNGKTTDSTTPVTVKLPGDLTAVAIGAGPSAEASFAIVRARKR